MKNLEIQQFYGNENWPHSAQHSSWAKKGIVEKSDAQSETS